MQQPQVEVQLIFHEFSWNLERQGTTNMSPSGNCAMFDSGAAASGAACGLGRGVQCSSSSGITQICIFVFTYGIYTFILFP